MDDLRDIRNYYDRAVDAEEDRLTEHQLEFELTLRTLATYLPTRGPILEIGPGTGRYTEWLLQHGYTVTAVELSPALRRATAARIAQLDDDCQARCTLVEGDARDLSALPAAHFSAALVMGPYYHLVLPEDRMQATIEVRRVLKPESVLFAAWLSRFGMLSDLLVHHPAWILEDEEVRSVLLNGHDSFADGAPVHRPSFRGYFERAEDIAPLFEGLGFETLTLAAMEPVVGADDDGFNGLDGEIRERWLTVLQAVASEPSLLGSSRHLLYVGRSLD